MITRIVNRSGWSAGFIINGADNYLKPGHEIATSLDFTVMPRHSSCLLAYASDEGSNFCRIDIVSKEDISEALSPEEE